MADPVFYPNPAHDAQEGSEQQGWSQPEFTHGVSPYYAGEPAPKPRARAAKPKAEEPEPAEAAAPEAEPAEAAAGAADADHHSARGRAGHRP